MQLSPHSIENILDVSPVDAIQDAEAFSFSTNREISFTDFLDLLIRQLRVVVIASMTISSSIFRDAVVDILLRGAEKKVVWVAAWRVITMVTHLKSFWDRTKHMFKNNSVAHPHHTFESDLSVARTTAAASPIPTRSDFVNTFPESLPESALVEGAPCFVQRFDIHCSTVICGINGSQDIYS